MKLEDEETAVPGVNESDVKNENESDETWCGEWKLEMRQKMILMCKMSQMK